MGRETFKAVVQRIRESAARYGVAEARALVNTEEALARFNEVGNEAIRLADQARQSSTAHRAVNDQNVISEQQTVNSEQEYEDEYDEDYDEEYEEEEDDDDDVDFEDSPIWSIERNHRGAWVIYGTEGVKQYYDMSKAEAKRRYTAEVKSIVSDAEYNYDDDYGYRFSIRETQNMDLKQQLNLIEPGGKKPSRLKTSDALYFGAAENLKNVGFSDATFAMNQSHYKKSRNVKHGVKKAFFNKLPQKINDAFIFVDKGTEVTIITDVPMADENGNHSLIVVGVWRDQKMDADTINLIKSVYPINDIVQKLPIYAKKGQLVITNKNKASEILGPIGIQSAKRTSILSLAKESLSQPEKDVNTSDMKFMARENNLDAGSGEEYNVDIDIYSRRGEVNGPDSEAAAAFRRLQEEARGMSREELELYHREGIPENSGIRDKLTGVLGRELEARAERYNYRKSLLTDRKKNVSREYYTNLDGETFHDALEIVQSYLENGDAVDVHDAADYYDCKNYLSATGLSGFSITKDGDLVSVFSMEDGLLGIISDTVKREAKTLDCYQSEKQPLADYYNKKFGFKVASLLDFNYDILAENRGTEYAEFFVDTYGEAPVAFMVNTDADVETRRFGKDDYDAAKEYQLSFVENDNGPRYMARESENEEKPYDIKKSFAEQIDDYKAHSFPENDTLIVRDTPKVFQNIGLPALPMTYDQKHLRRALANTDGDHLGETLLKQLPKALENPIAIIDSDSVPGRLVAIIEISVGRNKTIAAVEVSGEGVVKGNAIDSNVINSAHSRRNAFSKLLYDAVDSEANGNGGIYYWQKNRAIQLANGRGVQFPKSSTIADGYIRSITDPGSKVNTSKAKSPTETKQFKRWFGKSKMVNEDGTPKVLYHQTTADFTAFDVGREGPGASDNETPNGIFMKESPETLKLGLDYDKSHQMPLYAAIKNPLVFADRNAAAEFWRKNIPEYARLSERLKAINEDFGRREKEIDDALFLSDEKDEDGYDPWERATEELYDEWGRAEKEISTEMKKLIDNYVRNSDYDGMILEADRGTGGTIKTYIAFNSNQVKSATDNIGTFSRYENDIRYMARESDYYLPEDEEETPYNGEKDFRLTERYREALTGMGFDRTDDQIVRLDPESEAGENRGNVPAYNKYPPRDEQTRRAMDRISKTSRPNPRDMEKVASSFDQADTNRMKADKEIVNILSALYRYASVGNEELSSDEYGQSLIDMAYMAAKAIVSVNSSYGAYTGGDPKGFYPDRFANDLLNDVLLINGNVIARGEFGMVPASELDSARREYESARKQDRKEIERLTRKNEETEKRFGEWAAGIGENILIN